MTDDIDILIEKRYKTHGDAIGLTDKLLNELFLRGYGNNIVNAGFAWTMIFNKLMRILHDPDFTEHWRDIEGYARLWRKAHASDN